MCPRQRLEILGLNESIRFLDSNLELKKRVDESAGLFLGGSFGKRLQFLCFLYIEFCRCSVATSLSLLRYRDCICSCSPVKLIRVSARTDFDPLWSSRT